MFVSGTDRLNQQNKQHLADKEKKAFYSRVHVCSSNVLRTCSGYQKDAREQVHSFSVMPTVKGQGVTLQKNRHESVSVNI